MLSRCERMSLKTLQVCCRCTCEIICPDNLCCWARRIICNHLGLWDLIFWGEFPHQFWKVPLNQSFVNPRWQAWRRNHVVRTLMERNYSRPMTIAHYSVYHVSISTCNLPLLELLQDQNSDKGENQNSDWITAAEVTPAARSCNRFLTGICGGWDQSLWTLIALAVFGHVIALREMRTVLPLTRCACIDYRRFLLSRNDTQRRQHKCCQRSYISSSIVPVCMIFKN